MNDSSILMQTPLQHLDMNSIKATTSSASATSNKTIAKELTSLTLMTAADSLTRSFVTWVDVQLSSTIQSATSTIKSAHETTLIYSDTFQNSPEMDEDYFTVVLASQLLGSSVVQISGNLYPCTSVETTVSLSIVPSATASHSLLDNSGTSSTEPEPDTENSTKVFSSHTAVYDLETDHYLHPSQTRMESSWHLQSRMTTSKILMVSPVDTSGINSAYSVPPSIGKMAVFIESSPATVTSISNTSVNINEELANGASHRHINDTGDTEIFGSESENKTHENTSSSMEMSVPTSIANFSKELTKGPSYRHISDSNNTDREISGTKFESKASNSETKLTGDTEIEINTTGNNSRQDAPYVAKHDVEPLPSLTSIQPIPTTQVVSNTGGEMTGSKSEDKTNKNITLAGDAEIKFNTSGNNSRQDAPYVVEQEGEEPFPCRSSVEPSPATQIVSSTIIDILLDSIRPSQKTPVYTVHKSNNSQNKEPNQTNIMYKYRCKQIENMTLALKTHINLTSGHPAITKIEPMSARQKRVLIITLVASFLLAILCFASMCCVLGGRREISIPATFGRVRYALSGRSAHWSVENVPVNGIPGRVQLNTVKDYDTETTTI